MVDAYGRVTCLAPPHALTRRAEFGAGSTGGVQEMKAAGSKGVVVRCTSTWTFRTDIGVADP